MKKEYTLLNNCYFHFCQDHDRSGILSQYHPREPVVATVKRQRISLKRQAASHKCLQKPNKLFKYKHQEALTRTQTQKVDQLKSLNQETTSSTHRPDQQKPGQSDRIMQNYSTRTNMADGEGNILVGLSVYGSEEKVESHCSRGEKQKRLVKEKQKKLVKVENARSQPVFRRVQNFREMAAKVPTVQSQIKSLASVQVQPVHGVGPLYLFKDRDSKRSSKYEFRQQNGHKRTVTIYSIDSRSGIAQQQRMQESMVEIDFFHPSTRRLLDLEREVEQPYVNGLKKKASRLLNNNNRA